MTDIYFPDAGDPYIETGVTNKATAAQPGVNVYYSACRRFGQVPSSVVVNHIHTKQLLLINQCLGAKGIKPLCIALVVRNTITEWCIVLYPASMRSITRSRNHDANSSWC